MKTHTNIERVRDEYQIGQLSRDESVYDEWTMDISQVEAVGI